jgi:protein-disulfide isomerase
MSPGAEDDDGDLTRKQRREQARGERKALEQAAAARAARRTRLTQLGIVVTIVVVVVVVIAIASGGSSKKTVKAGTPQANATVKEIKTLIGGIPQSANTLGDPNAPVTLKYFGDLECPICKEFTLQVLPTLIPKYVKTGKLKIEYHSLETATREPEVFKDQQVAAYAAGKQSLAWDYIELFYHEQGEEDSGYVTESYLQGLAQQVPGLNLPDWSAARNDPALAEQITRDSQTVTQQGFTGTPSFLLGKSGGSLQQFKPESFSEPGSFEAAINKLLS